MPYKMQKNSKGQFCVMNAETGENKGCSDTMEMGKKHMAALYSAENKEYTAEQLDELVSKSIDTCDDCDNPKSFVDKVKEIVYSILPNLNKQPAENKDQPEPDQAQTAEVAESIQKIKAPQEAQDQCMFWKEGDVYKWMAIYSNNYRDDDHPAEIITAESHRNFIQKTDKGETPMPELWLWHVKDWAIGKADTLAWDDSGFALAVGHITKGFEPLAEQMAKVPTSQVRVSHGMPIESVKRDSSDPSHIVEHITKEISWLPYTENAANKITGFIFLNKEYQESDTMTIPADKKDQLVKLGISAALLDSVEQANATAGKALEVAGIESKEVKVKVQEPTAPVTDNKEVVEQPAVVETPAPVEVPITRQEIADALAAYLTPLMEQNKALADQLEALKKELATKATAQEQAMETIVKSTPASLSAMIARSVIGNDSARVDGRSSLGQSKPKESQPVSDKPLVSRIISNIITESSSNNGAK